MSYSIKLSIDIEETPDGESSDAVADMTRYYDIESLDNLAAIVANFGKVAAALIEGEKLGMSED